MKNVYPVYGVGIWTHNLSNMSLMESGCGSVGRAVAFNARGPRFESSHRQKFILNTYCQLYWKDENKEKEAVGMAHLKKPYKIMFY